MLRNWVIVLCALVCACASSGEPQAQEATPITLGQTYQLRSSVLNETREINVWTPPDYAESADRYTVVYLIDGGVDQDFPHIAGLAQLGALSWTYQKLIIVGVRTNARRHELTPPIVREPRLAVELPEAGGAPQFREYLERDVIPFIESHYRIGPRRAILGESLGGLFVVETFLERPSLFQDYIAVSPSLWWDNKALALSSATRLAGRSVSDARLYLTIANEGAATQTGMDALVAGLRSAPANSVTWRYVDRSASETHATILHGAALDAFRWLYGMPEGNYGPTPWYYLNEADRAPAQ